MEEVLTRDGSTLGQGQSPNFRLAPKCDMKRSLTNSKHRHIGAKRSVLKLSKYAKKPARGAYYTPQTN